MKAESQKTPRTPRIRATISNVAGFLSSAFSSGSDAHVSENLPDYAVFDDYRYSQRIAVVVRWFLLTAWLFLINYRPDSGSAIYVLNGMGIALVGLNGFVHWRIWQGRPITGHYVAALSLMDLAIITAGLAVTNRFDNTFFVFYYPALLGLSLVFSSRHLSFAAVALVASAYAIISVALEPGVSYADGEEKALIVRIATMFAVVAAASLMTRIERTRRREAVAAEKTQAQANLELQQRAHSAELAAQEERSRIAREIHDGVAQSIYILSLQLETYADLAQQQREGLPERMEKLVALSKESLMEVRHYIFDLKPYLAGEKGVSNMVENQVSEFSKIAGIAANVETKGEKRQLSATAATCLYRVTQEALANVFKHAQASHVGVVLEFLPNSVHLTVQDDGQGFNSSVQGQNSGHGLRNMRQRAEELGGDFDLSSASGEGTRIAIRLPC